MRSIQKVLRSVLELQSRCTMFLLWSVLIDGSWRGEVYRVYARWCCANTFFDVWWRIQWNRRGRTQVLEIICWAARYDRCNWDGDALGNRFVGINPLTHEQFIDEEKGGLVMEKECVQCLCLMLQWTKLDSFIWLQTERPRLYDQCILWHQCASLLQLLHQHSCKIPEDLKRLSGGKGPFADAGKVVHYETATRGLTEVYAVPYLWVGVLHHLCNTLGSSNVPSSCPRWNSLHPNCIFYSTGKLSMQGTNWNSSSDVFRHTRCIRHQSKRDPKK